MRRRSNLSRTLTDSLKARTAGWLITGTLFSLLFSAVVAWVNLRTSAEHNVQLEVHAMASSFRGEILSGQLKSAESKMRRALALKGKETIKILNPEMEDAYYNVGANNSWPDRLKSGQALWSGMFDIKAAAPLYFDQDRRSLFGYVALNRMPELNWNLVLSIFGSLMFGQLIFALFYRASVVRVGTHLSRQLETLSENLEKFEFIDIQEEKIAEIDKIRAAFRRATSEIDSLNASGKGLRQVAHDIRSPLTALSLGLQSLKEIPTPTRELLETAYRRMDLITSDLLTASKETRSTRVKDLRAHFESLLNEKCAEHVERSLSWGFKFECDETALTTLPLAPLTRTISNLLNNAAEASSSGQLVRLEVSADAVFLKIAVIDEGPGIPHEAREGILAGGISTKPNGHGLGLSSANKFARMHGGRLLFRSLEKGFQVEVQVALSKLDVRSGSA
jgi:signal transduction histidine kinase